MTQKIHQHIIAEDTSVRQALTRLEQLGADAVLFVVDDERKLLSSLTDGDIRRGLIRGATLASPLRDYARANVRFIEQDDFSVSRVRELRSQNLGIVPVVDGKRRVVSVVNFRTHRSYLPIEAVIMAGGLGTRLLPLTENTPKPLLKVGGRPILEHNVRRLASFGIRRLTISVRYLADQIVEYFGDGQRFGMDIKYIWEDEPRGTLGAVSQMESFVSDTLLIMNSDVLTTVDFEEMLAKFVDQDADMVVGTVPYEVKVPYGILETQNDLIVSLKEKPTYTYYANAGIYMMKTEHTGLIPHKGRYSAPNLIERLCHGGTKVIQFPILDYWLDVGKPEDFARAQRDIEHLDI